MAIMAAAALLFAWSTIQDRRKHDHLQTGRTEGMMRSIVLAPIQLPALGFVPNQSTVIAGLQVAEALAQPSGREMLDALFGRDAESGSSNLERWTGLSLDEIDHLVLAMDTRRFLPPSVLIVETRNPYDWEQLRRSLKASRSTTRGSRALFQFKLGDSPLDACLWPANDRCLVLSLAAEDLDAVPASPNFEAKRFPAAVEMLLKERIPAGTQLWGIAHGVDMDLWLNSPLLPPLPPQLAAVLTLLETVGFWLQWDQDLTWNLDLGCGEAQQVSQLAAHLHDMGFEKNKRLKLFESRPSAERLANEISSSLTEEKSGNWLRFQARTTTPALLQALSNNQ
jgi:hypothetical protein